VRVPRSGSILTPVPHFSLVRERNNLKAKFESWEETESKLKRAKNKAAIQGFPWVEVNKGDTCDQELDSKTGSGVRNGHKILDSICQGKGNVSS
jgi:hypothetical protein